MHIFKEMVKNFNNFIKKHIILFSAIIMILFYIMIVFIIYKIRKNNLASWEAISALGEWASILIAVLIPIAAVYLEKQIEKNNKDVNNKKEEIKDSNLALYDELSDLKKQIHILTQNKENFDKDENLKYEIYKYICISMITTTKNIMEKFKLTFEEAHNILCELSRVDEIIKPAYIDDDPDNENCNWVKVK